MDISSIDQSAINISTNVAKVDTAQESPAKLFSGEDSVQISGQTPQINAVAPTQNAEVSPYQSSISADAIGSGNLTPAQKETIKSIALTKVEYNQMERDLPQNVAPQPNQNGYASSSSNNNTKITTINVNVNPNILGTN